MVIMAGDYIRLVWKGNALITFGRCGDGVWREIRRKVLGAS
jgi:hypothetical protein